MADKPALTPRQEAFAQAVASGMNQSDAYRSAYSATNMKAATIHVKACELMAEGKIRGRVAELRQPAIKEAQYDLLQAMKEAAEAMEVARSKENGGAMVAAVTLRAKLSGLLIEKKEIRTGPLEGLPPDDAKALIEAIDAIQRARATGSAAGGAASTAQPGDADSRQQRA